MMLRSSLLSTVSTVRWGLAGPKQAKRHKRSDVDWRIQLCLSLTTTTLSRFGVTVKLHIMQMAIS